MAAAALDEEIGGPFGRLAAIRAGPFGEERHLRRHRNVHGRGGRGRSCSSSPTADALLL